MVVAHGLSWCEARGIFQDWMEAVSHTLVGRLSTTEPPGTPDDGLFFILKYFLLSSKYFIFRKHYLNIFTHLVYSWNTSVISRVFLVSSDSHPHRLCESESVFCCFYWYLHMVASFLYILSVFQQGVSYDSLRCENSLN